VAREIAAAELGDEDADDRRATAGRERNGDHHRDIEQQRLGGDAEGRRRSRERGPEIVAVRDRLDRRVGGASRERGGPGERDQDGARHIGDVDRCDVGRTVEHRARHEPRARCVLELHRGAQCVAVPQVFDQLPGQRELRFDLLGAAGRGL